MKSKFTDAAQIGEVKRTKEGYVSAFARAVRSGIQDYGAWENEHWLALADAVGKGPLDVVRVYRPPESVFSKDSLKSAVHIPITIGHPPVMVDSSNWAEYAVGETGSDIMRDGELVAFSLMLKDDKGTSAFDAGVVELSAGYTAELTIADKGLDYDYVMGPPDYNHLALVPKGRAGSARIGDAQTWGAMPINLNDRKDSDLDMVKLMVGDKAVQVAANDADIITTLVKDHKTAIDAKDTEIVALTKRATDAEAKILTDAQISELVTAKSKSDADRAKVLAILKDEAKVKAMSDEAIAGALAVLGDSDAGNADETVRNALKDAKPIQDAEDKIKAAQMKFLKPEGK